jgi:hypothetical protein
VRRRYLFVFLSFCFLLLSSHAPTLIMDNSGVDSAMHDIHHADVQDQGMMDSMDDLFGDASDAINVNVNLSLPAVTLPPPPALIKRVSELQASGACA